MGTAVQQLQPLHDRILIRPDKPEDASPGGIILPPTAQEKTDTGVVMAKGPGRITTEGQLIPTTVEIGDRVMFFKMAGRPLQLNGEEMLLVPEADIDGVLTLGQ